MGHWTPTGVEPKDYDDDDDEPMCQSNILPTLPSKYTIHLINCLYLTNIILCKHVPTVSCQHIIYLPFTNYTYFMFSIHANLPYNQKYVCQSCPNYAICTCQLCHLSISGEQSLWGQRVPPNLLYPNHIYPNYICQPCQSCQPT